MSVAVHIRPRQTKSGTRYQVRYRRGGRGYALEHGGTFSSQKEARLRRDLIAGWLAAGRDPREELRALKEQRPERTLAEWARAYQASRIDYAEETKNRLRSALARILPSLGERFPKTISPADVQEWIAGLVAAGLKPSTVIGYTTSLRQLLDFTDAEPNPARHRSVRLPKQIGEEPQPPSARHLLRLLRRVPPRWTLPFILMEQTGMTVGETAALVWGDVDEPGRQLRLRRVTVKAGRSVRARWVQVPAWLMDELSLTCPTEDRTDIRTVFPGFTVDGADKAMGRACVAARIPHFTPHDLRHRRLSLWHGQGVPARELAARAGHARASMSLDVYSHVMPLTELSEGVLRALVVRPR